ncbi:MAG: FAD-dependent oxidoreductase [Candidatus Contendobacter sp.]|nr:MAG: FAD-dependent oxidoreductase [Candidatus Contendobacter sp.]
MTDHDLLIIGAGISGLSMAHYAVGAGLNVLVLERERQPGGCLCSHRFGGALDGFWLELGAHSCFNSYGNLLAILERVGVLNRLQRRAKVGFRLFADGAVRSIPSQLCFPELLLAPFRLVGLKKAGRDVAEYYGRLVGPRNYAAVFEPAFDAVICQPATEFPAENLFRSRPRRKDVPRGFTLAGGLQTIADILAGQPDIPIEFGRTAREIGRAGEDFVVRTDRGEYAARALCLATPVAVAATLLRAEFPELAAALAQIQTATVESVGVALPADRLSLPPVAGLIGRNETFYSVVSRDTAPDPAHRGFTFHFRPGALGEEGKLNRIAQVLNVPRGAFGAGNVATRINRLPALRVGHGDWTDTVDRALAGSRLALTGNYFTGVAIEDCVTRSRQEFERLRREGW